MTLDEKRRPLKTLEITVAMQSRGYRQSPNVLMRAVRDLFKRYPGRFVQGEAGRWSLVI